MAKLPWTCWHEVVRLREDLRSGELPPHMFAADRYEVLMQSGKRPVYEDPEKFFALTFPTYNLRRLVRDVVLRVAGLCFDKLDVEKGMEVHSPTGKVRTLKQPWSVLAYQIAGDEGLKVLHADNKAEERESAQRSSTPR